MKKLKILLILPLIVFSSSFNAAECSTDIHGLWIQGAPSLIEGEIGGKCGCRSGGSPFGDFRRCFHYFGDGIYIGGYIKDPAKAKDNCQEPIELSSGEQDAILEQLKTIIEPGKLVGIIRGPLLGASGECSVIKSKEITSMGFGTYIDITYPRKLWVLGGRRICTSYIHKDDALYLGDDPSGGVREQSRSTLACGRERFTNLIKYTKIQ